jgi:hypothetical protein
LAQMGFDGLFFGRIDYHVIWNFIFWELCIFSFHKLFLNDKIFYDILYFKYSDWIVNNVIPIMATWASQSTGCYYGVHNVEVNPSFSQIPNLPNDFFARIALRLVLRFWRI